MKTRLFACGLPAAALSLFIAACGHRESPTEPTPTCSYTISPTSATIGSEGGDAIVAVTTTAGCAWSAAAGADWITVTGGATGTGPGTVTYSVAANPTTTARTIGVTVAGQNLAITQVGRAPLPCSYALSPGSAEFNKDGGAGAFSVAAGPGCAWTATSSAAWVTIDGTGRGSGDGTVSYTVSRQLAVSSRTATIEVAGRTFTVRQSGDAGACQYSVTPVRFSPCMPGGTVTATITTEASCPWTATPATSWLDVTGGSSGAGSASIAIAFGDNYDAPRDGIVQVRWPTPTAGQNIQIAQAGCRYVVSRTAIDVAAAGGTATFDVLQQSDPLTCGGATQDRCLWTARADVPWIAITSSMPRSGDNPVAFLVAPNDGASPRTGTIVVRDKVVVITQAGR